MLNAATRKFVLEQTEGMGFEQSARRIQSLIHCPMVDAREIVAQASETMTLWERTHADTKELFA